MEPENADGPYHSQMSADVNQRKPNPYEFTDEASASEIDDGFVYPKVTSHPLPAHMVIDACKETSTGNNKLGYKHKRSLEHITSSTLNNKKYKLQPTVISNRFSVLSYNNKSPSDESKQDTSTSPIPPIFIMEADNFKALSDDIKKFTKTQFNLKLCKNKTKLCLNSTEDFRNITR